MSTLDLYHPEVLDQSIPELLKIAAGRTMERVVIQMTSKVAKPWGTCSEMDCVYQNVDSKKGSLQS